MCRCEGVKGRCENDMCRCEDMKYQYVPRKAVAEVPKTGNLREGLVAVNHGWQSEPTNGSKGGWR